QGTSVVASVTVMDEVSSHLLRPRAEVSSEPVERLGSRVLVMDRGALANVAYGGISDDASDNWDSVGSVFFLEEGLPMRMPPPPHPLMLGEGAKPGQRWEG
ncbi:unnamed protein product, partial [Discosporangium mesarthrocarpum]